MNSERNHEQTRNEARDRVSKLALGLMPVLGDLDAAGTLIGAGATVLMETRGTVFTAAYLREIASEIEAANV